MALKQLADKIVLVTGANKGMGFQTALNLASRNVKVIMADKDDQTKSLRQIVEQTCNEKVTAKHLDLGSFKSIRRFSEEISKEESHLDVLVNNAGVFCMKHRKTCDGIDAVMQINHLGPFLLTNLLIDPLKKSGEGRIVFVTSSGAFFNILTVDSMLKPKKFFPDMVCTALNYYNSKVCTMIASKYFAKKLNECKITSNCLHPGMTNTTFLAKICDDDGFIEVAAKKLTREALRYTTQDVKRSVGLAVFLATSNHVRGVTGEYFVDYQVHRQPRVLEDEEFCEEILRESARLVGLDGAEKSVATYPII